MLKGLITVKDIFKRREHPDANKDQHGRLRVAAAVGGTHGRRCPRARALVDAGCDVLVVDSAHGHSEGVLADRRARCARRSPTSQLVGGNIATEAGRPRAGRARRGRGEGRASGPGSICTTRVVTGVGVPQLTAIMDAVRGRGRTSR